MGKALKVTRVSRHLAGARITVKAKRDVSAYFDSIIGEREFFLEEGEKLSLVVKGYNWHEGDRLSLSSLVGYAWDWGVIPWDWAE